MKHYLDRFSASDTLKRLSPILKRLSPIKLFYRLADPNHSVIIVGIRY